MKISGIYSITHTVSGRTYIGSAHNIHGRWREHTCALNRNKHDNHHLQAAWIKYGSDAFTFGVLEIVERREDLIVAEQRHLDDLFVSRHRFNMCPTAGSTYGIKRSAETKAKMSAAQKGKKASPESRAKMRDAHLGVKHTAERNANKSLRSKGRLHTAESKAKIGYANSGFNLTDGRRRNISESAKRRYARTRLQKADLLQSSCE